ncbi:hypothetical protein D3C86_1790500 [compost metagenome]
MVPSSRNDTVGRIDSHLIQEKFQRIFFDRLVVNKTNRFSDSTIFYARRNLLHQTLAQITIDIQLGISGNFYHVGRNALVIKNIEYAAEIVSNYII